MTTGITSEKINEFYQGMLDSVNAINTLVKETWGPDKQDTIDSHVLHLVLMSNMDIWTTEDMTSINEAIIAGRNTEFL